MSEHVLDSSAVLAAVFRETGIDVVRSALPLAVISSVNYAEVVSKMIDHGYAADDASEALDELDLNVVAFTRTTAEESGRLRSSTRDQGLSLGDRACLALAIELGVPALTADKRWSSARTKAKVELIR